VPAVQKVREAAARAQTNNSLKQLGLAAHNASDSFRRLPPAFGGYGSISASSSPLNPTGASVHVHLLPFVEQQNLYNLIQQNGPSGGDGAVIATYLSSADPSTNGIGAQVTNFAANLRVFSDIARIANPDGPAPTTSPNICSINVGNGFPDGTSNTLMFATRYSVGNGVTVDYRSGPDVSAGVFFAAHAPGDTATAGATLGIGWTFQDSPPTTQCDNTPSVYGHSYGAGGLSVCLGDGSVRQVNSSVSGLTWRTLVHPSDGRVPGPDWE